jgi:hypothetical protein
MPRWLEGAIIGGFAAGCWDRLRWWEFGIAFALLIAVLYFLESLATENTKLRARLDELDRRVDDQLADLQLAASNPDAASMERIQERILERGKAAVARLKAGN